MPKSAVVLTNAHIHTMDASLPVAEAMAIAQDGRILAVGSRDDVLAVGGRSGNTIDLGGRTVVPGFFDCHMHIMWLGSNLRHVDLSSPPVGSVDDIVSLLSQRLTDAPDLLCVQGNRYDQNKLKERNHPNLADLDKVSRDIPVRIVHTSGHAAVVNSAALKRLGIDRDTPDPMGGEIVRDAAGNPTGLLLETASWNNLDRILPEPTRDESLDALSRANRYMLERGITSASDANTPFNDIGLYREAVLKNLLLVRTNLMVGWAELAAQSGGSPPGPNDVQPEDVSWHRLHVGQAKLFSDGAITTRTCWLTEPFENMPRNYGIPLHPPEELQELILSAHNAGWQIATHAIGDRAVDLVLNCYAEAQRQKTRHKPNHRIEHCMLLNSDLIARLRRQNVWSIGQPEFLAGLGDAYIAALGMGRACRLSPYASLEEHGVAQAFSSDCPVVPGSPLAGIRAAVQRRSPQGVVLNDAERLRVDAALYAYTAAPAFATRTDRDRGTLSIGKFADFAVLSADPLAALPGLEDVRVEATFIGGKCLYGAI